MSGIMSMLLGAFSTAAGAVDEFFNRVTLLLPGNGTNGAQNNTFLDSSSNNFSITRNGNTTQGTFSPFSQTGWSNFFLTSDNYFGVSGNSAFSFNADFTVECFVFQTARSDNGVVTEISSYLDGVMIRLGTIGGIYDTVYVNGTNVASISTHVALNTWVHIAVVRSGTAVTVYVNGTSRGTATISGTVNTTSGAIRIAAPLHTTPGTQPFQGYISNFRIVKGTAVYTSGFTPPTAPLTAITNTSFLTCQSNRFVDNSTNNFTITTVGTPSVQAFSPFLPTAAYSAATVGGSGYFDGTGDNLVTPSNTAFDPSGQNVTVDFWVYLTRYPQANNIVFEVGNSSVGDLQCNIVNTGEVRFTTGGNVGSTISGFNLNAWNYITCVKSGTSFTVYLNAVAGTGATLTPNSKTTMYVGSQSGGTNIEGYISNFRYVRGSANVPSSVPTAPLTAITNTSLLLNFTNAGITDATAKNDLETVGNAQISTTQSKFGGSSMYFDGSGDNLASPVNVDLNFNTGNFTVEAWVYISSRTLNYPLIVGNNNGSWSAGAIALQNSNNDNASFFDKFCLAVNDLGASPILVASSTNSLNTWYHVAVVRNGTTLTMYRDGTSVASTTISSAAVFNWGKGGLRVGGGNWDGAQSWFNGYIDDLRITRTARYTSNFTAPTSAFPLQ